MEDKLKKTYVAYANGVSLEEAIEKVYEIGKIDGRLEQLYILHPELLEKYGKHTTK